MPDKWDERSGDQTVNGSPITRRILAINVFALAVLVVGLLYEGQYREGMIKSEVAAMKTQAEMVAAALGEAAVGGENSQNQFLRAETAAQIIRRLSAATRTDTKLISITGEILADSRLLAGPGGMVKVEELPPPAEKNSLVRSILDKFDLILRKLLPNDQVQMIPHGTLKSGFGPEARKAMTGDPGHAVHFNDTGSLSITTAVPVQRYKQVLGALTLTKDASSIDDAVFQVRLDILKVFGVALLVTVLLSIYLAGSIARPIQRLAAAADQVRTGLSRNYSIPDLTRRTDEIGHLSAALKDMTEALWDRMDAIERFAADVAHEIKNPLTSLRSAVETAARINDPAQQSQLMSIIQDDIKRLDRLISDISDASRLDSELSRAAMEPVDMAHLLNTLKDIHTATTECANVIFSVEFADERPMVVRGLEDRIVQVLRNLIGNAVSFSPPGGAVILKAKPLGSKIIVTVEDEGPGIPEGSQTDIFKRFYQERPKEEKFGTHSGLGLSISKQIVETHGGRISAENRISEQGEVLGARFTIQLPVSA
ncbi:MAG: histidine kinase [Rhodospirillaceae bacterium]|nr:histidine kinase [Rhodospirillaceae bacterium]